MSQHNHHFIVLIVAGLLAAGLASYLPEMVSNAVQPSIGGSSVSQQSSLTVTFTPLKPNIGNKITFTATGYDTDGISRITIFVDKQILKKCDYPVTKGISDNNKNRVCAYTTSYNAGVSHTYYATMTDLRGYTLNDPKSGVKAFDVKDNVNPKISFSAIPTPGNHTAVVSVTDETLLSSAKIFVNNKEVKSCNMKNLKGATCSYADFSARGTYAYYATAVDAAGNSARTPASGTNSFTVP